jgi:hypothetical protein
MDFVDKKLSGLFNSASAKIAKAPVRSPQELLRSDMRPVILASRTLRERKKERKMPQRRTAGNM